MLLGAVAAAGNICCCWEHFGRKSSLPTFDALEIAAWAFVIEVACADWVVRGVLDRQGPSEAGGGSAGRADEAGG